MPSWQRDPFLAAVNISVAVQMCYQPMNSCTRGKELVQTVYLTCKVNLTLPTSLNVCFHFSRILTLFFSWEMCMHFAFKFYSSHTRHKHNVDGLNESHTSNRKAQDVVTSKHIHIWHAYVYSTVQITASSSHLGMDNADALITKPPSFMFVKRDRKRKLRHSNVLTTHTTNWEWPSGTMLAM